ncbi:MAG: 3-phosphoshikimate 1-carboxyvinyltransferase [Ornithinimicrobium sp.]
MHTTDPWSAPYADGPVSGTVRVPGSKSLTNRYLVLAALATGGGHSTIHHPLVSRDTSLMRAALEQFGLTFESTDDDATWTIHTPGALRSGFAIDAGLAGTVMRFLPPVAALANGWITFDGDAAARTRPIGPLVHALRDLGIRVDSTDTTGIDPDTTTHPDTATDTDTDTSRAAQPHLPLAVHGTGAVSRAEVTIDASTSSQFVSALLLAGARFEHGLRLRHRGANLPSRPHIDMTLRTLRQVGVRAHEPEPGLWSVEAGPIAPLNVTVEPDLSSAAPFLALAAVTGGTITVPDWPATTTQAGDTMRSVLSAMGARVEVHASALTITGPPRGTLRGIDIDLHDVGELTPVIAAVAAHACTPSRLRGVAHLRGHETDRLQALHTELSRMGGDVAQREDGLAITPSALRPASVQTYHDHRMAMAGAVLGVGVRGTTVVDINTTSKTYPGFADAWSELVR